jgi:hypothetical protein
MGGPPGPHERVRDRLVTGVIRVHAVIHDELGVPDEGLTDVDVLHARLIGDLVHNWDLGR